MKSVFMLLTVFLLSACDGTLRVNNLAELVQPEQENALFSMEPDLAFELLKQDSKIPVLVEFSASWCHPCNEIRPYLRRLAHESQGRYRVVTVDVSDHPEDMLKFGMQASLPGFVLKIPGQKEQIKKYGSGSFAPLTLWLQSAKQNPSVAIQDLPLEKPRAYQAILIAGSSESANFLQELLWNYSWLIEKGLKPEEIGCFYGKPDVIDHFGDADQFNELAAILRVCSPINKQNILASIKASLQKHPPNFYLYVSSHGAGPVAPKNREMFVKQCLPQAPALILNEHPSTCESRRGLTPEDLVSVLKESPDTKKYLVLQGCFTGGFISNDDDPKTSISPLAQLPHMKIITASSATKASFGCSPGVKSTLFGYAYSHNVVDEKAGLDEMDWQKFFSNVQGEVEKMENDLGVKRWNQSEPQFYQN